MPAESRSCRLRLRLPTRWGACGSGASKTQFCESTGPISGKFAAKDGLAVGSVRAIGGSRHLWVAGEHGLALLWMGTGFAPLRRRTERVSAVFPEWWKLRTAVYG